MGFGSFVLETGDGIIFRIARTPDAAAGHELEWRVLRKLRLTVATPRPQWRIAPGHADFRFGAVGHRKLGGRPLAPGDPVEDELARVLGELHALAPPAGLPLAASWRARLLEIERLVPALAKDHPELRAWWGEALTDPAMVSPSSAIIHGDLWYENVLVEGDPPRVTGLLDWGTMSVGDPAEDLAPQFYLGEDFAVRVLDAYGADESLRHRIARYCVLREFAGIRWSFAQRDRAELAESIEKLRRVLRRNSPPR